MIDHSRLGRELAFGAECAWSEASGRNQLFGTLLLGIRVLKHLDLLLVRNLS